MNLEAPDTLERVEVIWLPKTGRLKMRVLEPQSPQD